MIPSLESLTTATLAKALEAASLRQHAIAANVANTNTAGFAPLRVGFEAQLTEARNSLRERGTVEPRDLEALRPLLEMDTDEAGGALPLQLDQQMADMARNAVHYQSMAQGLSRHFGLLAMAAAEGRK
ncbi:flagellar basal body protein [Ramlibacter sp. XY19]|uniref:flagellar basal body rod protein FlgB n=1 Tax=Ramlibacter paludis TaxID=2908000 RepID=UPI0023DADC5E|nr:flagellar basal body protein [Ramlibacter paludis]MCG2594947.1 flagellar basal body protein [Ramlibacter paludis]